MIVYLDSSVLVRVYLTDEPGHAEAAALLGQSEVGLITGTWSRIEVSGALIRASRLGCGVEGDLLALLDDDLGPNGPVTTMSVAQGEVEEGALRLVREHAIRPMDAWHLATATLVTPRLLEPGEAAGFASRDRAQSDVAEKLGFRLV